MARKTSPPQANRELEALRAQLAEAQETLRAIQQGEVDALVVEGPDGPQTFTLRGVDHLYRTVVETMNEGALTVSESGLILYANQRLAALLATPLENLLGAPLADFIARKDTPALETLWRSARQGRPARLEMTFAVRRRRVATLVSMSPLTQDTELAMSLVVTDLTQQKRIEAQLRRAQAQLEQRVDARTHELGQALRLLQAENEQRQRAEAELSNQVEELHVAEEELRVQSQQLQDQNMSLEDAQARAETQSQRYQALFDFDPDAYLVTSAQGVIREANRTAEQLLGMPATSLLGKNLADQISPDLQPLYYRHFEQLLKQVKVSRTFELAVITRNETRIPVEITAVATHHADEQVIRVRWALRDISDRKQAEAALEAAHAQLVQDNSRLAALMETLPVGIVLTDARGGIHETNALYEKIWGAPLPKARAVDDYAQYRAWWADTGQPVQPEEWASAQAVQQGVTVLGQTMRIRRFDGTDAFVLNNAAPIRDARGQVAGCAVAIQDITPQMETEAALRRSNERFRLLSDVAAKLLATDDPQSLVNDLCTRVMAHLDCQVFFNFLADPAHEALRLNACAGISDAEAAKIEHLDYGVAVCGRVAQTGQRIVAEDIQHTSSPLTALVKSFGVQAYACHPLLAQGQVIGTLSFGTRTRDHYTADELALMKIVADQVALAMERIESARVLRRTLAEAEDAQRLLEAFLEYAPEGITIADAPDGTIRRVSRYGQELLGTQHTRLTTAQVAEVMPIFREDGVTPLPPEETPLMRAIQQGEVVRDQEMVQISAAGQRLSLLCNAAPLRNGAGEIVGGVVAWRDISARKRAENALRLSEQRFRLALKNAPVTVATQDLELRYTWAYNQNGARSEAIIGKTDADVYPRETAAQLVALKRRVLETGADLHESLWVANGRRRTFLDVYMEPILNDAGEIMGVGVATVDLTEQKKAEAALQAAQAELEQRVADRTAELSARSQELQQTNARLHAEVEERRQAERQLRLQTSALQAAASAIVITDREGNISWSNPAFTSLTGYTAAEARGQTLRLVGSGQHPPDFFRALWQTILTGHVWEGEIVNRRKDGTVYAEQQTITPVRDEAGQISHFIAIKQDVTERRRLELELVNANSLLEKVFASIDLLVAYLDRDFNYLRVNRAYAAASQQAPEDFVGRNFLDLRPGADIEALFRQAVATGEPHAAYDQPLALVSAGSAPARYWDWSLQPVHDAAGSVQGLVFSLVDVTQRKQAEDSLRLNAQRSQALAELSQTLAETTFDLSAVLHTVTRRAAELFDDVCLVALVSEDETELVTEIMQHPDPAFTERMLPYLPAGPVAVADTRIGRHIIMSNQPLFIPVVNSEAAEWFGADRWAAVRDVGIQSVLGLPLQAQGRALGLILLFRLRPGLPYTVEDLHVAQRLADRAAMAIANARLYQNLQAALTQEKATRAQLMQAEKLAAMGRVVGSVAHEINNPLQTISNCLFLLAGDLPPDSAMQEYLEMASSETERLTNLVGQLRDVYRPRLTGTPARLDLLQLLGAVQTMLAPSLTKNHVEWRVESSLVDAPAQGVADQLKQVFINLSQNALEAMQPGGGVLTVNVRLSEDGREVGVAFCDTGPGLSSESLERLFEPFFSTKPSGLGLGLAICNDIVKRHGGRLVPKSEPGKGAEFTAWLPVASA